MEKTTVNGQPLTCEEDLERVTRVDEKNMVVWYQGKRTFQKRGSRRQSSKGQGPKKSIGFLSKKTSLKPSENCSIFLLTFYFELMIDSQFIV